MEGLEELEKIKKFQFTYPILRIGKEKRETTTVGKIFEKELSTIENKLKALKEIVALHDKWLGYGMSDFEFFTLLNDIRDKCDIWKEAFNYGK